MWNNVIIAEHWIIYNLTIITHFVECKQVDGTGASDGLRRSAEYALCKQTPLGE